MAAAVQTFERNPARPLWMGILNVTPDSFSDGGLHDAPDRALRHALALREAGADIVDVGAESTRPGFAPVPPREEWRRLAPVLPLLAAHRIPFSVDTRHPSIAARALALGAALLNDVSGLRSPGMRALARDASVPVVLMHGFSSPLDPADPAPSASIARWFRRRLDRLPVPPSRIVLDPGLGFGTTRPQDAAILADLSPILALRLPLLVAPSRKRFLAVAYPGLAPDDASARAAAAAWRQGAAILRMHAIPKGLP